MLSPDQIQSLKAGMGASTPTNNLSQPATADWVDSLTKQTQPAPRPVSTNPLDMSGDIFKNTPEAQAARESTVTHVGPTIMGDISRAGQAIQGTGEYQGQGTLRRATGAVSDIASIPMDVIMNILPKQTQDEITGALNKGIGYLSNNPLSRAMGYNEAIQHLVQNYPQAAKTTEETAGTLANVGNIAGNIAGVEGGIKGAPVASKAATVAGTEAKNIASDVSGIAGATKTQLAGAVKPITEKATEMATNAEKNAWVKPTEMPQKTYSGATEIYKKAASQGHNIEDTLLKNNIRLSDHIDTSATGRKIFNTQETADALRTDAGKASADMLRPALKQADATGAIPRTPVKSVVSQAIYDVYQNKYLTAEAKSELADKLANTESVLKKRYPSGMSLTDLHDEKITRGFNTKRSPVGDVATNMEAQKNEALRDVLQNLVEEKAPKDIPVAAINKEFSKLYRSADYLDALHGKTVPQSILSKVSRWTAKVVGAGVGSHLGGGIIGGLGGYHLGGIVESLMENIPTEMRNKLLNNIESTNPEAFNKIQNYLKNFSDQTPNATADATIKSGGNAASKSSTPMTSNNLSIDKTVQPFEPKSKTVKGITNYLKNPKAGLSVENIAKNITMGEKGTLRDFTDYVNGAYKPDAKTLQNLKKDTQEIVDKYGFSKASAGDRALANQINEYLDSVNFSKRIGK